MNKDLHDIDKLFLDALGQNAETPSSSSKEKLVAALDKKDVESNRRRFIWWKRTAMVLFLLLSGFILFESGWLKKTPIRPSVKNKPISTKILSEENKKNETAKQNAPSTSINIQHTLANEIATVAITNDNSGNHAIPISPQLEMNQNLPRVRKKGDQLTEPVSNTSGDDQFLFSDLINKRFVPMPVMDSENNSHSQVKLTPGPSVSTLKSSVIKDSEIKNPPGNKKFFVSYWLVTGFASYEQVGYKLDSDDPLAVTTIRHHEVHEPSFSGNILFTRQITNHWGLQLGLGYTRTQIGISPQKMYALQLPGGDIAYKFITSSGYAYIKLGMGQPPAVGDSIITSDAKHLLKHISIPLVVKYRMGKNKLTVSPSAGIEANFISSAKVEVGIDLSSNREIVTVNKLNGIKTLYCSVIAGAEVQYQLDKKISIMVRPAYRQALSSITKNNVVETFPHSFGIGAGITIKF